MSSSSAKLNPNHKSGILPLSLNEKQNLKLPKVRRQLTTEFWPLLFHSIGRVQTPQVYSIAMNVVKTSLLKTDKLTSSC